MGCLSMLFWFLPNMASAQLQSPAELWADSVLKSLNPEQRIGQLMILRLSGYDFKTKTPIYYDSAVMESVRRYNIGGVCLFQGTPNELAVRINQLQSKAQTPLLVAIDAEWGLGMRLFNQVTPLPHQMMLGAVQDSNLLYQYGTLVGRQCRRMGIHVNFAPVVDINNNPANPVINDRSFGEDKYQVARMGLQYMRGMQDAGVMACAKHFPGHGDVSVDSHLDLPIINKSLSQLDSLEWYPFRRLFAAGVGSVMIAHLYIPSIDSTSNKATSLSYNNVTTLLRKEMRFAGLSFTDALEMQGVAKFYPNGSASVESLVAGNDLLCLPGEVNQVMAKIKSAIEEKRLSWEDIDRHCRKVLLAKYEYIGRTASVIDTNHLQQDLNKGIEAMKLTIADNAITVLRKRDSASFPISRSTDSQKWVYVGIGLKGDNAITSRMKQQFNADVLYFDYLKTEDKVAPLLAAINKKYQKVVIGIHAYNRTPANHFGISAAAAELAKRLQELPNSLTLAFGNPYALHDFCGARNLIACYEDDAFTQQAAADLLQGKILAKGRLPVTVCDSFQYGSGLLDHGFFLPLNSLRGNGSTKSVYPLQTVLLYRP